MGLRAGNSAARWWDPFGGAKVPFVALATLCLLTASAGDDAAAALRYSRVAVTDGEWWRLVSAHLVHLGPGHLALNLAGLALVGWLTGREYGPWAWWGIAAAAGGSVTVGLYLLDPTVGWYVGLSGILHGLLVAGLMPALRRREPAALVLAALVLFKLAWEALAGPLPGSGETAGGPVLIESHRYGALAGAVVGLGVVLRARLKRTPQAL